MIAFQVPRTTDICLTEPGQLQDGGVHDPWPLPLPQPPGEDDPEDGTVRGEEAALWCHPHRRQQADPRPQAGPQCRLRLLCSDVHERCKGGIHGRNPDEGRGSGCHGSHRQLCLHRSVGVFEFIYNEKLPSMIINFFNCPVWH